MSRPAKTPRLRDLDPKAVADEVQTLVAGYVSTQALRVGYEFRDTGIPSTLHGEARALTVWAQHGRSWDWVDSGDAWDAASQVCSALYSCAAEDGGVGELIGEADPATSIGVVLVATHCRVRIDQGESVTVRQLGALASMDANAVRVHVREGRLVADDGDVEPAEARRWLGTRGVEPFATSK
jgi:hypothetical protein